MTTETEVLNWWICDGFLDMGGRKIMGPFVSRNLAMEVRTLRETVENHASYFVDSEAVVTAVVSPSA